MALTPGSRLGSYEIIGPIGSGGMGDVYRARDARLHRSVAIKVLPDSVKDDPERRERFEREARAVAALNHPNIVTIHSVERAGDVSFLTMELVEGRPLTSLIPKAGLSLDRMLRIALPVVDAIAAAHQKGITHRDLKPANIMVGDGDHQGRVKVLDFGLAKVAGPPLTSDGTTALPTALATGEGRILGTVAYMSPEQAEGRTVDARSDLFSLGVILYEMATGQRPFAGDTSISIISAIVKDTPPSVTDLNPALPRDFGRIVKRALAKDPERRYQTAKDLRNDLEDLKASLDSGELTAEARGAAVPARASRLWPWTAVAAAMAAVVTVAFVAFRGEPSTGTPPASAVQLIPLTSSGNAELAAIAPDGKYVAYVQTMDGRQSIWVHQIASRSTVQIVPPAAGVSFEGLTVMPDGSFVDFVRLSSGQRELWRVPFLGGPARKLIDRVTSPPGWSPDGMQMAFLLNVPPVNAERQLIVADPDGSNQRVVATRKLPQRYLTLTLNNRPDARPLWLPDGRSIAVRGGDEMREPGAVQLVGVDVATGAESVLHDFLRDTAGGFRAGLAFTSDPRWAIGTLSEEAAAPPQVVRLDLRDGTTTKLTNDLASYGGITLAGDAVVTTRYEARASLWIADATGRGARQIGSEMPSSLGTPVWAGPSRLIYSATLAGGSGLWAMDVASGTSQLIVPNAGAPSVSADGRILVFNKAGREIWRAEADGSRAVRLNEALGAFPRIAPDGSRVYYISARSGVQTTWVVDLAGGAPRQFSPMQTSGNPVASPDGRLVLLASGAVESPGTFIVKAEGGEPVHRLPVLPRRGDIWWTPDGQGLAYIDASSGEIRVQPIDGGAPRPLTALTPWDAAAFARSPDGKQLVFTRQTVTSNVVLLKGVK